MDNKVALIYLLLDPRSNAIRYVGLTRQSLANRLKAHLSHKGKTHRSMWIQSLVALGLKPVIELVRPVPVKEGPAAEILEIRFRKEAGCDLVNLTTGGEGTWGHSHTVEAKNKMRAWHLGKRPSEATRQRLRTAKLNQSKETRSKIGAANSRRVTSQSTRDKLSEIRRKYWEEKQKAGLKENS